MKKLKLEIDSLDVESFESTRVEAGAGTVQGAAYTPACPDSLHVCPLTDPSRDPCGETYSPCGDTSDPACGGSAGFTWCTCVGSTGC